MICALLLRTRPPLLGFTSSRRSVLGCLGSPAGRPSQDSPDTPLAGRSPLRELFDFDLAPLREQAGLVATPAAPSQPIHTSSSRQRLASLLPRTEEEAAGGASVCSSATSGRGGGDGGRAGDDAAGSAAGLYGSPDPDTGMLAGSSPGEADKLDRLWRQLQVISTAGGLQDRQSMTAQGQTLYPTSPIASLTEQQRRPQQQHQENGVGVWGGLPPRDVSPSQLGGAAWPGDEFAELGAEQVEEEGLNGGEQEMLDATSTQSGSPRATSE
jgi:hypothetical protein